MKKEQLPVCDKKGCRKPAVYNLQSGGYTLYSVDDKGEYEWVKQWGAGEEENSHYCEKHAEEEGIV